MAPGLGQGRKSSAHKSGPPLASSKTRMRLAASRPAAPPLLPPPRAPQRHAEEAVLIREEANVQYQELLGQLQAERDARAVLEVRWGASARRACLLSGQN